MKNKCSIDTKNKIKFRDVESDVGKFETFFFHEFSRIIFYIVLNKEEKIWFLIKLRKTRWHVRIENSQTS